MVRGANPGRGKRFFCSPPKHPDRRNHSHTDWLRRGGGGDILRKNIGRGAELTTYVYLVSS